MFALVARIVWVPQKLLMYVTTHKCGLKGITRLVSNRFQKCVRQAGPCREAQLKRCLEEGRKMSKTKTNPKCDGFGAVPVMSVIHKHLYNLNMHAGTTAQRCTFASLRWTPKCSEQSYIGNPYNLQQLQELEVILCIREILFTCKLRQLWGFYELAADSLIIVQQTIHVQSIVLA